MQDDHVTFFCFQGNTGHDIKITVIKRIGIEPVTLTDKAAAQGFVVTARDGIQAAVFFRRIVECKPETDNTLRLCIKISAILMPDHLAANTGRFENEHGLQHTGIFQAHFPRDCGQAGAVGEGVKYRIQIMHGMTDLVDGLDLVDEQVAILVNCFFFQKTAHSIAGVAKIFVAFGGWLA